MMSLSTAEASHEEMNGVWHMSGQRHSFCEFVVRHDRKLHSFVRCALGVKGIDADAHVNDTFARVWDRWSDLTFDSERQERAYLYTTARHLRCNWWKRVKDRPASVPIAGVDPLVEENPAQSLEFHEDAETLWKAVSGLRENYRTVLYLIFGDGLTRQEAASVMGATYSQVNNWRDRAIAQLKTNRELEQIWCPK